jgi:hypothetical protein
MDALHGNREEFQGAKVNTSCCYTCVYSENINGQLSKYF